MTCGAPATRGSQPAEPPETRAAGTEWPDVVLVIPLRLWICAGVFASLLAFALGLRIIVRTLLIGVEVPGYASLTVMLLFFSGIQMIGIGVIGEYVGRSFIEAKRRPAYVVKRIYD